MHIVHELRLPRQESRVLVTLDTRAEYACLGGHVPDNLMSSMLNKMCDDDSPGGAKESSPTAQAWGNGTKYEVIAP
jgi:hypothetical protein